MIAALVLAAGEGRRFGGAKQLARLGGRPLIEHVLAAVRAVPAIERVAVVLGANAEQIRREADLGGAEVVIAPDWSEGIAASLRAGVAALAEAEAIVVVLADQPLITPQVIAAVLDAAAEPAVAARATYDGRPGHPVVIRRELFPAVTELRGDAGARELLVEAGAVEIDCAHLADPLDIDTPADLEVAAGRAVRDRAG